MISFYPGPSRVYTQVPAYVQDAYTQGILSANHRSTQFTEMAEQTVHLLKDRLAIPADYSIFFVSSSTECWEIISQSLVKEASFHVYNGAFGEKWFSYAQKLQPKAFGHAFDQEEKTDPTQWQVPQTAEIICLAHNETSNATALSLETLHTVRQQYADRLIAVDATSSMAGIYLDMALADVWYASVQKCFGLPAGMAVLVCSPAAIQKAQALGEQAHYNSLVAMIAQMQQWQTTHTPNVLTIYLLMRTLESRPGIRQTESTIESRCEQWIETIEALPYASLLIKNPKVRSKTVVAIEAEPAVIDKLRSAAKEEGIIVGNGYGKLKNTTLRIANFPAIEEQEIEKLRSFLTLKIYS